uniref:Uncharacterized protein n=1 Tax=Nicotiana tabacum TaxID=4097 RepID=A0A1S3WYB4_TOBAC|nr:PREDICTED: uncharacterized protein LOC107759131 [Nicotiana tabacum]
MGGDGATSCGSSFLKGFLRAVLLLSFLCCVSAEILVKQRAKTVTKAVTGTTSNNLDVGRTTTQTERHFLPRNTNLNYVSKRRVWSEADPIHNREAGKYMETRIRA